MTYGKLYVIWKMEMICASEEANRMYGIQWEYVPLIVIPVELFFLKQT
jgi:hypothetical protein